MVAFSACGATKPLTPGVSGAAGTTDPVEAGGAGQHAGTDAEADTNVNVPTCPKTIPVAGDSCDPKVVCLYGGQSNHACVTHARCESMDNAMTFQWTITPPSPTCGTHPAPCPAAYGAPAEGLACPEGTPATCDYDVGRCGCETCMKAGFLGPLWTCHPWASGRPGCPTVVPLVGDACVQPPPPYYCSYGHGCEAAYSVGDAFYCSAAGWQIADVRYDCGGPPLCTGI